MPIWLGFAGVPRPCDCGVTSAGSDERCELVERLIAQLHRTEADATIALRLARMKLSQRQHGLAVILPIEGDGGPEPRRIVIDVGPEIEYEPLVRDDLQEGHPALPSLTV